MRFESLNSKVNTGLIQEPQNQGKKTDMNIRKPSLGQLGREEQALREKGALQQVTVASCGQGSHPRLESRYHRQRQDTATPALCNTLLTRQMVSLQPSRGGTTGPGDYRESGRAEAAVWLVVGEEPRDEEGMEAGRNGGRWSRE